MTPRSRVKQSFFFFCFLVICFVFIHSNPFLCLLFAYANADTMQSCRNFDHYFIYYKCEVFIASPFCDCVHEGQAERNLSWTTMNAVTQSWIIVTLTIGCEKITISRQHSEPIEFEELSRQLRQWSRGKEGNARFANDGTFSICLLSFWVSLWTLESEVSEWAFSFSSDCHEFLKRWDLNKSQLSK